MASHLPSSLCLWQPGQWRMPTAGQRDGREQDGAFTPPAPSFLDLLKVTAPVRQPSPYKLRSPLDLAPRVLRAILPRTFPCPHFYK